MSRAKHGSTLLRVGFGTDLHRLVEGNGLWIGGVLIPCPFSSEAVSDGDVLLHALVDALLGASGLGDIGEWFPESSVKPGQASAAFVDAVMEKLRERSVEIVNVDATVDLQNVRLAEWKPAIRENVASLLGIDSARVNVKAKTAERLGPIGEGVAIAAQAVVLLDGFGEERRVCE